MEMPGMENLTNDLTLKIVKPGLEITCEYHDFYCDIRPKITITGRADTLDYLLRGMDEILARIRKMDVNKERTANGTQYNGK